MDFTDEDLGHGFRHPNLGPANIFLILCPFKWIKRATFYIPLIIRVPHRDLIVTKRNGAKIGAVKSL